ncbi:MAG: LysE family transporter [Paracoccaceae bacterium]|nr:LysE family transporter [Paracoccaceae bacterium]
MDYYFVSLIFFASSMVASPGPANMILLVAGSQYGLRKSLPFVLGIITSKQFIIWPIGFGILTFFDHFPTFVVFIKGFSCIYIIWLAWKLSNFKIVNKSISLKAPSFFHGLPVHPTNPKAWAMVSVSFANYTDLSQSSFSITLMVALVFIIVQLVFHILWCYFGYQLKQRVQGTTSEIWLMRTLSILMLASLVVLFL